MIEDVVLYTCHRPGCAVDERVLVRARGDELDVIAWLDDTVRPAVTIAHENRHPECGEAHFEVVLPP